MGEIVDDDDDADDMAGLRHQDATNYNSNSLRYHFNQVEGTKYRTQLGALDRQRARSGQHPAGDNTSAAGLSLSGLKRHDQRT